ncbi:MAG: hypothetical protein KDA88_10045 [Planctomycetaceae bacterium]|nr:hypothetical protein [Planctomycetaceae bacterium]MCB9953951.1 hypothetical protein [Planctomycetaceae bacterium]
MAAFYTLLYVAPPEDAETIAVDANEDAMERYPNAWLQYIGDEELVALWDILEGEDNDGTLMGDLTYASPEGDVMVMAAPEQFVIAVGNIAQGDLERVAEKWQSSDLMVQWTHADVIAVLTQLIGICRVSMESGHPLLQVASI